MKGTAAIHLHAAITSVRDLELLYPLFTEMAFSPEYGMSSARREIWDRTDRCRCSLPEVSQKNDARLILSGIVDFALDAIELNSGKKFRNLENINFSDFLIHLTTMFTDIRVNVKGVTLELRTPDSRPLEDFPRIWRKFIDECEEL